MWCRVSSGTAGRRRLGWAFAAIALVVSLAGCVSMQDSGPPGTLQVSPSGTTQDAANIGPIPASPPQNLSPANLVLAFLEVSASYSTYPAIVKSYLTQQEAKAWNPQWSATVFSALPTVTQLPVAKKQAAAKQVTVTVQGQVQATFSGSGQYLSVAQGSTPTSSCTRDEPSYTCEQFTVTESGGQWRIAKLPRYLLLDDSDFSRVYQPQDLYFFGPTYKVLVPDTVFVPLGTPASALLTTLVSSLIPQSQGTSGSAVAAASQPWLSIGTTVTSFPIGTKQLAPVTVLGNTATVDLGGTIAQASQQEIQQVMDQLAWTFLASPSSLYTISTVDLDINGTQVATSSQTTTYAPYPPKVGVFTYVVDGVAQSRCGSTLANFTGPGVPVFAANGTPALATCGGVGATPSPTATASTGQQTSGKSSPSSTAPANPLAATAASSDGQYLAGVSAGRGSLSIWSLGTRGGPQQKWSPQGQTISSISWDLQDDLWIVTHSNSTLTSSIYMVSAATGKATPVIYGSGNVVSLSVAPDGVRAALIVQNQSGSQQVDLAGIYRGTCQVSCRRPNFVIPELIQGPVLGGPGITDAISLAWYNQDNLYVIDKTQSTSALWQVPVSGRPPRPSWAPPGPYRSRPGNGAAETTDSATTHCGRNPSRPRSSTPSGSADCAALAVKYRCCHDATGA